MTASAAINSTSRFLVFIAVLSLFSSAGCRRNRTSNSNSPTSTVSSASDPEEAKRQAKSLLDKGKELADPDHNQDEQAVQAFQAAIRFQPDFAEAHLRLGMAYAALDKKTEAEESYKKAIELYKKSDSKDADAFFNLGEAYSFLHRDEE